MSDARALSLPMAITHTDFYEVIFVPVGGEPVRTSWMRPGFGTLTVPAANYDNGAGEGHGSAYMFVGLNSNRTLLGVGTIDAINSQLGETEVNDNTRRIDFLLSALVIDVNPSEAWNDDFSDFDHTKSSFFITPHYEDQEYTTVGNTKVPIFLLRKGTNIAYLKYEFSGGNNDLHTVIKSNATEHPVSFVSYPDINGGH